MSGFLITTAIIIGIVAIICSIVSIAVGATQQITDRKFNLIVGGCGLMAIIVAFSAAAFTSSVDEVDAGVAIGSILAQLLALAGCVVMVQTDINAVRLKKEEENRPMSYEEFQKRKAEEAQRAAAASDPEYAAYLNQRNQYQQ